MYYNHCYKLFQLLKNGTWRGLARGALLARWRGLDVLFFKRVRVTFFRLNLPRVAFFRLNFFRATFPAGFDELERYYPD